MNKCRRVGYIAIQKSRRKEVVKSTKNDVSILANNYTKLHN